VPIFDAVNRTFALDRNVLNDLAAAGISRFEGEVPVGSMVLVGHTCSFWKSSLNADPKLSLNLNWVVVLGVPK
jgi:hypothetical protein